jgi:hypothetical protein
MTTYIPTDYNIQQDKLYQAQKAPFVHLVLPWADRSFFKLNIGLAMVTLDLYLGRSRDLPSGNGLHVCWRNH